MARPAIENRTPFAFTPLFQFDEEGRPLFVALLQATYDIVEGRGLSLSAEQPRPRPKGVLRGAGPAVSSYLVEPPFAFLKPATDVVLVGHAVSPRPVPWIDVGFRVGPVAKTVRVTGDRVWSRTAGVVTASPPQPFERIPLAWERAFGGWDRSHPDPAEHRVERRNPVGVGFRAATSPFEEGLRLPNLEDPSDPQRRQGQVVTPAGFGFVSPHWLPRAALCGTCDAAWKRERMPLLPRDFDRRFFNAAAPGLVAPLHLVGGEPVVVENASRLGRLSFQLPGGPAPACRVRLRYGEVRVETQLDTVIVDTDASRVILWYRGHAALRDGPHDVSAVEIRGGPPTAATQATEDDGWRPWA